jgi:hypothetical protein
METQTNNNTLVLNTQTSRKTDLVIIADGTGSMGSFLNSLSESLVQIVQIIDITNVVDRVCMIVYNDYCDKVVTLSSGWQTEIDKLMSFIVSLRANGGGDAPEAAKTAANDLLNIVSKDSNTVVVWYTDAPPHHASNSADNYRKEKDALDSRKGKIFDWVKICDEFVKKNIVVYPIINQKEFNTSSFYVMMSTITGGKTLYLSNTESKLITRTTIKLFLGLMGCECDFKNEVTELVYNEYSRNDFIDEDHSGGYLPVSRSQKNISSKTIEVSTHPWLATNLRTLVDLFNKDVKYKNRIYTLFESLLKQHTVLALTYNVIFATFWRLICRNYEDSRKDMLRGQLTETLEFLKKTNKADHVLVTEWISDSYNQTFEVNEIISKKATSKVPALVLDTARLYSPQELLELSRSCNPKVLAMAVDMMSSLRVVDREDELPKTGDELDSKGRPLPLKYVPLSLSNRYLFSVLPHLMAPGSNFSIRPSVIMAIVAYITNNVILKERAKQHLEYHKGNWIDFETPENYSGGFINLMLKVPEFLNASEIEFFTFYQKVFGLVINGCTDLTVQLPFSPYKKVCHDYKKKCDYCNYNRSFTLLTKSNDKYKCGICYSDPSYMAAESQDDLHSVYLECKSCFCHYALINVHLMNVTPKCHGCRYGIIQPTSKCTKCLNKYVDPAGIHGESFVCPQCNADPKSSIDEKNIVFKDIYNQNQKAVFSCVGFEMPTSFNIFGGHSLFALKDQVKKIDALDDLNKTTLFFNRKPILNSANVLAEMLKWINTGTAERGFCMICFNEFSKSNLRRVCGHKMCKSVACGDCLKSWYGENKIGDLIHTNSLTCPFCKQYPSSNILASYNRQVCAMVGTNILFDINWWYGWCVQCFQPKKVVEKECNAEAPKLNSKFTCDDCNAIVKPDESKQCPNSECGIAIIKNGGCHHIECTACKKHFCWLCADASYNTSQETYDHLYKNHGGAYGHDDHDDYDVNGLEEEVD